MSDTTIADLGYLAHFTATASDDPVKTDLELQCDYCGEHLCDFEAGDSLDVLARTAAGHVCDATEAGA